MNDPTGKGWAAQNDIQTYPEVQHPLYTSEHRISQAPPADNISTHILATRFLRHNDLLLELLSPLDLTTQDDFDTQGRHGITPAHRLSIMGPAKHKVIFRNGRYKPNPNGTPALIFPDLIDNRVNDLVAWDGQNIASRTGHCFVLGAEILQDWSDWLNPVRLYRDPGTWLASDREGVVIVDQKAAWRLLWWFNCIEGDDQKHCQHLRKILQPPHRELQFTFKREIPA